MIEIAEWGITCSKDEALDLVDVLNYGGECIKGSVFAVNSYGVNDMDVMVTYSEGDIETFRLHDEQIDYIIRYIEEKCQATEG
jgi:hypothetical protein